MDNKLFDELMQSVSQMDEIRRGERAPSRETYVASDQVKRIRKLTNLSQAKFAHVIDVEIRTLQNWEQGRRKPTGPARALLRAIEKDPGHVIAALVESAA